MASTSTSVQCCTEQLFSVQCFCILQCLKLYFNFIFRDVVKHELNERTIQLLLSCSLSASLGLSAPSDLDDIRYCIACYEADKIKYKDAKYQKYGHGGEREKCDVVVVAVAAAEGTKETGKVGKGEADLHEDFGPSILELLVKSSSTLMNSSSVSLSILLSLQ